MTWLLTNGTDWAMTVHRAARAPSQGPCQTAQSAPPCGLWRSARGHAGGNHRCRHVRHVVGAAAAVALDDFFERGLSKDPSERFQSARELAEDLHRVIKAAKVANPALVVVRPSMMSLPAVEMPTVDSSAKLAASPKVPPMRPRAQSFVFGIEDEIDMTNGGAPSSGRARDPRRE